MAKNVRHFKTTSFLGENSYLEGELTLKGGIRIDGHLKGSIHSDAVIYVGSTAEIEADIAAAAVISSGKIAGNIDSIELVQIALPGSVKGDIETRELIMEKGVYFAGSCKIKGPQE